MIRDLSYQIICAHILHLASRTALIASVYNMAVFAAFQTPLTLLQLRPSARRRSIATTTCTISNSNSKKDDGERLVRFRKESTDDPLKTFKKANSSGNERMATPNERLLKELEESINELGLPIEEASAPVKSFADYSHVRPWAAFSGSAGAAAMAVALWYILQTLVEAYNLHPLQSDFYVVQRLVAVVRTAVVGLLALASGISGVTSVGLLLLGAQVTYDSINEGKNDDSK